MARMPDEGRVRKKLSSIINIEHRLETVFKDRTVNKHTNFFELFSLI